MGTEMKTLLETVLAKGATDLHIEAGKPAMLRVKGLLEPIGSNVLSAADTARLMESVVEDKLRRRVDSKGYVDFGFCYGPPASPSYFLITAYKQGDKAGMILRRLLSDSAAPGACPVCGGKMQNK